MLVMHMASLHKIHVRTGCSCNPGACQRHLQLSSKDVKNHFRAGHVCGDLNDLVDGVPTGSIRISFGYMSKKDDVDALLRMIRECFVQKPLIRKLPENWKELQLNYNNKFMGKRVQINKDHKSFPKSVQMKPKTITDDDVSLFNGSVGECIRGTLKCILLYPIKSCGAFSPPRSWRISSSGLEYDRKWMIVNSDGSCLSQKQNCNMCLIKPMIDIERGTLELTYPDEDSFTISIHDPSRKRLRQCESKICRDKVIGYDCGDSVSQWLNKCLGCQGLRLIQQTDQEVARVNKQGQNLKLSFANESQYLMVNLASVQWLKDRVQEKEEKYTENLESMILRFRPNIVIDFELPFVENELESIHIDKLCFKTVGSCTRCQMICINQVNAQKTKEPLITLAREFEGKVKFGVYLGNEGWGRGNDTIVLGSDVMAKRKM